ncbi:4-carboxy-4-hydroxy-2-oxoadipate aldolase/oxaloacetate decarboxylase [Halorussus sp. AFM4]|uniref:4-carboxy-4-hydroxy-2-oxoadipate aldolase/oxaloacetate decarboxylase n=1 Tax=Halorussus sp. AFM4 TaxID=3421651 RepID=UPI003EB96CD8
MSSNEVVTDIDRPAAERVEALADVPTAVVSDVTSAETVLDHEIGHAAGRPALLGTAVTVRSPPGDNLMVHRALQLAEAGDVLVVDAGGHTDSGIWGELTSTSARAHGLRGTVVDGAVRDIREIDELGYPVYARAVSPKGSHKTVPGSINVPVACGGVTVNPGDVIVGDAEGVAVVPKDDAETVAEAAEEKLETETELRERVADGEYLFDLLDLDDQYRDLEIAEH